MVTMTLLEQYRPLTADDLEAHYQASPDDRNRYEIIDGTLIVTPAPAIPHQRAVGRLYSALVAACPRQLEVMLAPLDVKFAETTVLQPDLLVATKLALGGKKMVGGPLLAVEVLSPSTRLIDLNLKFATYQQWSTAGYWVVDPIESRITAWELADQAYAVRADAGPGEKFAVDLPFPLRLDPASLTA
ncbi:MAG: Uma2 family endonuclease [Nocardioides sp.]